jgi:protein-S-isoprenylcysteine O-methyltransferase Ste14
MFDMHTVDISRHYPSWVLLVSSSAVTLLWGVFTWASVAMGFKGSNLTNRGIVARGPYRFVRHPAYIAKFTLWCIEGIFFAAFSLTQLAGFGLIYFLRAWTEERHLSRDPDYLAYKKKVRWMFIPGLV